MHGAYHERNAQHLETLTPRAGATVIVVAKDAEHLSDRHLFDALHAHDDSEEQHQQNQKKAASEFQHNEKNCIIRLASVDAGERIGAQGSGLEILPLFELHLDRGRIVPHTRHPEAS